MAEMLQSPLHTTDLGPHASSNSIFVVLTRRLHESHDIHVTMHYFVFTFCSERENIFDLTMERI